MPFKCKVILKLWGARFSSFHWVFPWTSQNPPTPSPLGHTLLVGCTASCLALPPLAWLSLQLPWQGPERSLGGRKWFSCGNYSSNLHRHLTAHHYLVLAAACSSPISKRRLTKRFVIIWSFGSPGKKKNCTVFWSHVHRGSTREQSQPLPSNLSITLLAAPFVSEQTETLIAFLLSHWNCKSLVQRSPILFLFVLTKIEAIFISEETTRIS